MKAAISAAGPDLDSNVDPRFGRAAYIIIADTDTLEFEAIDNKENVQAFKGAGINTASMVVGKGAKVLLTGLCGANAAKVLEAAKVKVITDVSGKVMDALKNIGK